MAREETIRVLIDKSKTVAPLQELKNEAKALKDAFGSIKIGDAAKALKEQASAAKEAANAATAEAKAQKEAANAEKARYSAVKELENATKAHLAAQKEEQNVLAANMKVNKEAANAVSAAAKAQKEMTNAETAQIRQTILLTREQERQTAAMRRLGQDIGQVNASQAQSIQYMSQWIRQQEGFSNATIHATGAINNANGSFQTYRAAVSEAGGATHNYRMAVNTATGEVYQLDQGIRTTSVSLRDMSSILRAVRTVVGFTGIAQSMRSAFTEMKSMSDELVTYRKVTGATAQEMERIRSSAYETSKRYGQTPSDFLSQAATMARAGYGQNATAMAELATKTQLVGDMTADAASKFLIAVDAGYKYNGSIRDLTAVLDAANEVDNNYATSIEKISEGMTLVASLAGSAHVPVEQLIAALGTMTAVTQRSGAEMARGLRSIMLNVMGDTSTEIEEGVTVTEENVQSLTDALNRYGDASIAAARKAGKIINPMQAIQSLAKAWKDGKLDESTLFGISKDIAGQRYYNAFSSLIQNYDMYESMLESIAGSAGSAGKEVNNMLDSWTVKANQLTTVWTKLVNSTISEGFIKNLLDGGIAALEFAGNLENLALMAGGAYEAIRMLGRGIQNITAPGAVKSLDTFGRFNLGMGIAGLGIAAVGVVKSLYEKSIRDAQEAAAKAVEEAGQKTAEAKSIQSIYNRYIATEKGDIETLTGLQQELNRAVGEQGTAIDLVNGKYEVQAEALRKLAPEQRELAQETAQAVLTASVATFIEKGDLNGTFRFGDDTGVGLPNIPLVQNYLSAAKYLQFMENPYYGNTELWMKGKPTDAEGIIAFLQEVEDFYTFLGTHDASGEKAAEGIKAIGAEYPAMYTALGTFVQTVRDFAGPVKSAKENLDEINQSLEETGESAGDGSGGAAGGLNETAKAALTLADAIGEATKAKEKFDDAMKTSKADAFNDYVKAFQTLQGEIDAGRVNSTAFYASARMLLGDEAYNQTGGTSEGVMAALNRMGSSGTLNRAGELLFGEYYDANGNAYEGAGLIELLRNTRGYESRITQNASGGWNIPALTETDINEISAAWGGLSKSLIMSFFEALDQYDVKGAATAEAVKTAKAETADAGTTTEKPELPQRVIEQQNRLAESTQALGEAQEKAAEQTAEALQTVENATSETEGLKEVNPDTTQARTDAEEWLALLTSIEEAYERINTQTVGYSPDLEKLFEDIDKLREEITLNIKTGAGTGTAALMAGVLSAAITTIEGYAKNGTISVTLAGALTGNLKDGLAKIIDDAQSIEELKAIELSITGNPSQLDTDVDLAIAKENLKKVVLTATAETKDAEDQIDKAAEDRNTTIKVKQSGAETASRAIDNAAKQRVATIQVKIDEPGKTGTSAPNVSGGSSSSLYYGNGGGGTAGDPPLYNLLDAVGIPVTRKAIGTANHPGGLSMVNDGSGPELIINNGRAFIAGGGKPAIVNLNKGAKIFTASETRSILSGSGIPAYAKGTVMTAIGGSGGTAKPGLPPITSGGITTGGAYSTEKPGGSGDSGASGNGSGGTSGGGSGGSEKKTDEKAYETLSSIVDYIIKRIGEALEEQIDAIDKQIDALKQQKDALEEQKELEEKQKAVAEAQKDLTDALNERTVRYLGDDGKWHWMADQRNVKSARESLTKAEEALREYEEEMVYNAQVKALESQKTALQEEYSRIAKGWSDIQAGVATPTGNLGEAISAVLTGGTPQEQTGAKALRDYLIGQVIQGGVYSGNFAEAQEAIAKATAGTPIMPGDGSAALSSLIAASGLIGESGMTTPTLSPGITANMTAANAGGGLINYNYYVDGFKISGDEARTKPLSEIMRGLTVYAGDW